MCTLAALFLYRSVFSRKAFGKADLRHCRRTADVQPSAEIDKFVSQAFIISYSHKFVHAIHLRVRNICSEIHSSTHRNLSIKMQKINSFVTFLYQFLREHFFSSNTTKFLFVFRPFH